MPLGVVSELEPLGHEPAPRWGTGDDPYLLRHNASREIDNNFMGWKDFICEETPARR